MVEQSPSSWTTNTGLGMFAQILTGALWKRTSVEDILRAALFVASLTALAGAVADAVEPKHEISSADVALNGRVVAANRDFVLTQSDSGAFSLVDRHRLSSVDEALVRAQCGARPEALLLSGKTAPATRAWTNDSGRSAEASLVAIDGDRLVMQRPSGTFATASLPRLSNSGQEFVRELVARHHSSSDESHRYRLAAYRAPEIRPSTGVPAASESSLSQPAQVIHVRVAREYLQSLSTDVAGSPEPFYHMIDGSPVSGFSTTQGHRSIALAPSDNRAIVDLSFRGSNLANSTSFGRWAQVSSQSLTNFLAVKRVMLDETGITPQPTTYSGSATNQVCGICPSAPGLRGAFIRRRVSREIAARSPASNADTARRVGRGVTRAMDKEIDGGLAAVLATANEICAALRDNGLDLGFRYSTTAEHLAAVVYRKQSSESLSEASPPELPDQPPVAIWIHNSLVQRFLTEPGLQASLQKFVSNLDQPAPGGNPITPANLPDYAVGWTSDGSWMTVTVRLASSAAATPGSVTQASPNFGRESIRE